MFWDSLHQKWPKNQEHIMTESAKWKKTDSNDKLIIPHQYVSNICHQHYFIIEPLGVEIDLYCDLWSIFHNNIFTVTSETCATVFLYLFTQVWEC